MVIPNCGITGQSSEVLKDCVMSKYRTLYKTYGGYHTGVDLSADGDIFSLYDGTVVSVGQSISGRSVIIKTGSSLCMCYTKLLTCNVRAGQIVSGGDKIGTVKHLIHVESLSKTYSQWPVRIGPDTWYKSDVSSVLYGVFQQDEEDVKLFSSLNIIEMSDYPSGVTDELSEESDYILSNNRGE